MLDGRRDRERQRHRANQAHSNPPAEPRIRLGRRSRKTILTVHLVAVGAWIGIDVIVAVLVFAGWFANHPETRGIAYRALATFVVWPMLLSGLVCLLTGLVLGWSSKWGVLRYRWVGVKLGLNLLLCMLIVLVLRPGMQDVHDHGRAIQAGGETDKELSMLFFPPSVSLTLLSFATVLAVFKPWGRIRSNRSSARRS
jgi:hypothetical protein